MRVIRKKRVIGQPVLEAKPEIIYLFELQYKVIKEFQTTVIQYDENEEYQYAPHLAKIGDIIICNKYDDAFIKEKENDYLGHQLVDGPFEVSKLLKEGLIQET